MNKPISACNGIELYSFVCYSHTDSDSVYSDLIEPAEASRQQSPDDPYTHSDLAHYSANAGLACLVVARCVPDAAVSKNWRSNDEGQRPSVHD